MKRQSTKTMMLALIAAASIVSLSACGNKEQPLQGNETSNQNQSVSEGGNGNNSGQSSNSENAANTGNNGGAGNSDNAGTAGNAGSATDTGTAAGPEKKQEDISVYYTDDQMIDLHAQKKQIAYSDGNERLKAAFEALQSDGDKGETSLWKNVQLLSAKQDGDAVTLDIHLPDEARLGAPGEQLALSAVTQTYFQFKDVASLNILVDGEAAESLMGHEDLEHPIKKQ